MTVHSKVGDLIVAVNAKGYSVRQIYQYPNELGSKHVDFLYKDENKSFAVAKGLGADTTRLYQVDCIQEATLNLQPIYTTRCLGASGWSGEADVKTAEAFRVKWAKKQADWDKSCEEAHAKYMAEFKIKDAKRRAAHAELMKNPTYNWLWENYAKPYANEGELYTEIHTDSQFLNDLFDKFPNHSEKQTYWFEKITKQLQAEKAAEDAKVAELKAKAIKVLHDEMEAQPQYADVLKKCFPEDAPTDKDAKSYYTDMINFITAVPKTKDKP